MKQYETTFIIDPVLSGDEIKQTATMYIEHLKSEGCEMVHVEEWGVRQLTYPMAKRSSGAYYTIEFTTTRHDIIGKLELAYRRDERILRYLTISLDKHAVKYNDDKRKGLIGKKRKEREAAAAAKAAAAETEE